MKRVSVALWIAAAGAVVQIIALTGNFYETTGRNAEPKSAWFGIPHASDLILASALVALVAAGLSVANRQPVRGRTLGLIVGAVGLLATLQLVYRMIVPPFGCLRFGCGLTPKADVNLLMAIWAALAGCVAVTLGGFLHAFSATAQRTPARPRLAARQTGMTPWLGLAAVGATAMFVFPFTLFSLYTVAGFYGQRGETTWGGWLSIPHTSSLVLALTLAVVGLVIAAGRRRSPLGTGALGATIALLALVAAARLLYRILDDPFATAGGAENVPVGTVTVELVGYLGLAGGLLAVAAGIVHAAQHRQPETERSAAGEAATSPTS